MKRKIINLVIFAAIVFILIVAQRLHSLYVIARVHPAAPSPADSPAAKRLETDVRRLFDLGVRNYAHPGALSSAADLIQADLNSSGYDVRVQAYKVHPPDSPAVEMRNLIAVLPATAPGAPILIVGTHYDTAPNTAGADDNGSGVAALMEIARRLRGHRGSVEIRFVAYSTEEPPFFGGPEMGSAVHAESLKMEKADVFGMICLEMIGYYVDAKGSQTYPPPLSLFYPDRGNFIGIVSNLRSRSFLRKFMTGFHPAGNLQVVHAALPSWIGEIGLSDQRNYWANGLPAVMITDTSFLRYPHYHQPTDTPERLDYNRMSRVVDGLVSAIDGLERL